MNPTTIIGVPSSTPIQTVTVPIPTGGTELVFLLAFGLSELLPFLGGRFKTYNGILQSLITAASALKHVRKEDEAVTRLRSELEAVKRVLDRQQRR